jgi:tetratricopeptide (TPR) repeat protein
MMTRQGIVALIILVTATLTGLFGEDCTQLENEVKALNKAFNEIRTKMSDKGISKEEYNNLKKSYNKAWKDLSAKKSELKACEEKASQKHKFFYNEAVKMAKGKDFKGAIAKLRESLAEKADFQVAKDKAVFYAARIQDLNTLNEFIKDVDKDEKAKAYYTLARTYKNKNANTAIKYYLEAAKYGREAKSYYWAGVLSYTKLSKHSEAIGYFKKSLSYKKDGKTYELLGACYMESKPTKTMKKAQLVEEAVKYLSKGVALGSKNNKDFHIVCARLAQAYNEQGKSKSALNNAIKSLQNSSDKNYGLAHFEKGRALFKMKKYDEAKTSFNIAKNDIILSQNCQFWLKEIEKVQQ